MMDKKIKEAALALCSEALDLNRKDFHVWIDFSGHVDSLTIRAHSGGYPCPESFNKSVYLDWENAHTRLDGVRDALVKHSSAAVYRPKEHERIEREREIRTLKELKDKYPEES